MSKEQRRAIDVMLRKVPQGFKPLPVEEMREGFSKMMGRFPVSDEVTQVPIELAGRQAVLVEPKSGARSGTILYFHGGSFSLGSPQTAMCLTAELVRRTSVRAISFDYRLAPEHPFPVGIEDCLAAYRSLLDDGIDPSSVVFAGDSAGGGLTVTTSLSARDAGVPLPAALVAFSPGLDHTRSGATMITKEGVDPFFTREGMGHTGAMYLAGKNPDSPLLAPAVHADLSGFPPILLQVGTNELLLDDSVRLATRARDAGVDVILDITADVPHVFQAFTGMLEEADYALDRAALFIAQHLTK
ncbi:alpha/beta hydrolase [Burkholderia sp. Leaf177]|uniref:alpha/beta hydrolase n=1 Tax=Burkholderia sp. Leaf177 TaxID=1736287 RepID=UPI0006F2BCCA|nr:alpha/beta hydrolase [Burkholderia sp. Leaf177]KQR77222.1 alpha/beta hydrolase [Burkholderia sp. Leaf177]